MFGDSGGQTALPPWQAQQANPSRRPLQRVPSKQTYSSGTPLVLPGFVSHGQYQGGGDGGMLGGKLGLGGASGGEGGGW